MPKHIVALGVGDAVMNQPNNPLHRYILSLAGTPKPAVLFLPTASGDNPAAIQAFYAAYTPDKCVPADLKLFFRDVPDLRSYILRHDIIMVGGGNTASMIAVWKAHGVDAIMREACLKNGTLPAGYAIDDQVALHFQDGELKAAVSAKPGGRAFKVACWHAAVEEQPLKVEVITT